MLLATADWHAAIGAWNSRAIYGDAQYSLDQVVDYAVANNIAVVAAGDLFDAADPEPETVALVARQLDRLETAGLPMWFITGNHDARNRGTWLGVHTWPTHLSGSLLDWGGGYLYGFDWTPGALLQDKLDNIPPNFHDDATNILVTHQVWKEFTDFDVRYEGIIASISGCCTMICGDYHGSTNERRSSKIGDHLVLSPGPLALQSVDEAPQKGFWVLFELPAGSREWRWEQLRTRPLWKFQVNSDEALRDYRLEFGRLMADWLASPDREALPEHIRKPIVAVWAPDSLAAAVREDERQLRDMAHFFVKARNPKASKAGEPALRQARYKGLIDALESTVAPGPVRADLERLLLSRDPAGDLAEIKAAYFAEKG